MIFSKTLLTFTLLTTIVGFGNISFGQKTSGDQVKIICQIYRSDFEEARRGVEFDINLLVQNGAKISNVSLSTDNPVKLADGSTQYGKVCASVLYKWEKR